MATSELVVPTGNDGFAGVIAMDTKLAAVTVTVAVPVMLSRAALTVAVPADNPVTVPAEPAALETATAALLDVQVTLLVRSTVELSE